MNSLEDIQKKQDDEYGFPYHYVSEFRKNFTQCFNDTWGINYVATIEFIISKLRQENFESLLDVGCGDGRLVKELSVEFPNKLIKGVDYSEKAIGIAKALNPNYSYTCADITSQQVMEADIVTLIEVFEHIPLDISDSFVEGIYNQLKTNGILFLTVPHSNKPVEYKHYRHFSVDSLTACFNAKFEIVEVIPFESNSKIKSYIDRILTNRFFILNNQKIKNKIYNYYKNNLFFVKNESECNRIFLKAIKK